MKRRKTSNSMEHLTLITRSAARVDTLINEKLKEGWELRGNLIIYHSGEFVQAMVRHEDFAPLSIRWSHIAPITP